VTGLIKNKKLFLFIIGLLCLMAGCQCQQEAVALLLPKDISITLVKKEDIPKFNEVHQDVAPPKEAEVPKPSIDESVEKTDSENQQTGNESPKNESPLSTSEEESSQVRPASGEFVESMEQQIIDLVNDTRVSLGIESLSKSKELTDTARAKSKDMYEYQYFDHNGHLTFSQLQEQFQIAVHISGENIYRSQSPLTTAQVIFDAWKSSPNHYANMVNDEFHQIGVGVYVVDEEGIRTYYVTQHFTD
jgi:SCP-like protein